MHGRPFVEMAAELPSEGSLVILDVDGTLVADGEEVVPEASRAALIALASRADVYVCSNGRRAERLSKIVVGTGARVLETSFRKPDPRVLASIDRTGRRVVVVGDKYLTDGLLAVLTHAVFYRVRALRRFPEPWAVTLTLALDATVGRLVYDVARFLLR